MPVHKGEDSTGVFYQWGSKGKKYYVKDYTNENCDRACAEKKAKRKALAQGAAAYAAGWKGK